MAFFDKNKRTGGFMDEIRCDEPSYLIWKWHPSGSELGDNNRENAIRWGSSLRVKDGEVAVFVYKQPNGQMQDFIVGPYDQIIKTENFPVLASIVGLAYEGGTPFQAEIYFINLAQIVQTKFAVPYFDVYDPRFSDFGVPIAVRGTVSFKISDYREFIKLHRLSSFNLEDFQHQIRDAVSRYIKDTVTNAPAANNIPVIQIESKTSQINDIIEYDIAERLRENFGVSVSGIDIGAIEIDKSSEGYRQLMAVTKDIAAKRIQAETTDYVTVVALLMKKQIIKTPKSWIHIVALAIAIVLIVPYFSLFGGNGNSTTDKGVKFSWSNLILGEVIPQPKSDVGKIITNTESSLSVYIYKTSTDDFYDYIKACKDKGFTVDAEQLTSSFNAYNESGYKLSLYYAESNKEMHIGVDAPVVYGEIKWSDNGLGKLLPTPGSKVGEVKKDDDKGFEAIVAETSIEDFKAYAKLCSDKGFSIDIKESDKSFDAKNADGYKLSVKYIGNNVMSISIDEPEYQVTVEVECVENWIFSKYDVDVYVDDSLEGTLSHGTTDTYSVTLTKGTYTIKFVSAEDDGVTGTVKIDISKDEDIKLKISCYSDKISVETISGTLSNNNENTESSTSESSKITVTMSEDNAHVR